MLTVNHIELNVQLAHTQYPIRIGQGTLSQIGVGIDPAIRRTVVISDETVQHLYGATVIDSLRAAGRQVSELIVPVGETSKSFERYRDLLDQMLNLQIDRRSAVIALGGGVVGDLAGFVAASYMRGIQFIQVPTTLLAQVDSSVGGKVGINLDAAKNSVGAFWHPHSVWIDPDVLQTLDDDNFRSGLAEVVKYGLIMDADFFEFLESHVEAINQQTPAVMQQLIHRCCQLKAEVVQEDERETTGRRAILNYGHTFGHAIENCLGYGTILHGHAVGMGMTAAANLALLTGHVNQAFLTRQSELLERLKIPCRFPTEHHERMLEAMKFDKKTEQGELRFVLPTRLGQVEMVDSIDTQLVLDAMQRATQVPAR